MGGTALVKGFVPVLLVMLALYGLTTYYIGRHIESFLRVLSPKWGEKRHRRIFWLVLIVVASCMPLSGLLPSSYIAAGINFVGYTYIGFMLYALLCCVIVDIARLFLRFSKKWRNNTPFRQKVHRTTGIVMSCAVILTVIGGMINARIVQTTNYAFTVNKTYPEDSLRIALVADLHLGYQNGERQMQKMVDEINKAEPDLVVIAGDILDGGFDKVFHPARISRVLGEIQSKLGVYAILGNHDAHTLELENMLADAGITLLTDDTVQAAEKLFIVGRSDRAPIGGRSGREKMDTLMKPVDKDAFVITLDHQPFSIDETAEAGGDLLLCGHTHAGQVFPGNLITDMIYVLDYGYQQFRDLHMVVSSGVGFWGPPIRVATRSEVAIMDITFTGK